MERGKGGSVVVPYPGTLLTYSLCGVPWLILFFFSFSFFFFFFFLVRVRYHLILSAVADKANNVDKKPAKKNSALKLVDYDPEAEADEPEPSPSSTSRVSFALTNDREDADDGDYASIYLKKKQKQQQEKEKQQAQQPKNAPPQKPTPAARPFWALGPESIPLPPSSNQNSNNNNNNNNNSRRSSRDRDRDRDSDRSHDRDRDRDRDHDRDRARGRDRGMSLPSSPPTLISFPSSFLAHCYLSLTVPFRSEGLQAWRWIWWCFGYAGHQQKEIKPGKRYMWAALWVPSLFSKTILVNIILSFLWSPSFKTST